MDDKAIDSKIADISARIQVESKVLNGANAMLSVIKDKSAVEQCELNVIESKRRLEFLETELFKLTSTKSNNASQRSVQSEQPYEDGSAPRVNLLASTSAIADIKQPKTNLIQSQMCLASSRKSEFGVAASSDNLGSKRRSDISGSRNRLSGKSGGFMGSIVSSLRNITGSRASLGSPLDYINAKTVFGTRGQSITSLNSCPEDSDPITGLDALKFNTALTSDKIKYRIEHVKEKVDIENRYLAGTENILDALKKMDDSKNVSELESQCNDSKRKLMILQKSEKKYSELCVSTEEVEVEEIVQIRAKRTGRLVLQLLGAKNIIGRRSADETFYLIIRIDGKIKGHTKSATENFGNEIFDIQVDKAHEIELCLYEHQTKLMTAFSWFNIYELEEDLKLKYPNQDPNTITSIHDVEEFWLDMEPGGQILLKATFIAVNRVQPTPDKLFRRNAVQKIYPRNEHKFIAQASFQIMQCAVCNELLSGQTYQCQNCQYVCHPRCYGEVITKCLTPYDIEKAKSMNDTHNTGQLLKYNIPHRFDVVTSLTPSWCSHCAILLPVGRKIMKCMDCGKGCHRQCYEMVPNFCGLKPEMAKMLVQAFEEHEKKLLAKEMDDAERNRNAASTVELSASREDCQPVSTRQSRANLSDNSSHRDAVVFPKREESLPQVIPMPASAAKPTFDSGTTVSSSKNNMVQSMEKKLHDIQLSRKENVTLDDFRFLAVLGRGAFGKVMLASELQTKQLYAIKALKKEFIIQNDDVKSTKLEKKIFQIASIAHHPFLVNLHSCFHTDTRIYFVMEYVPGGDLMSHMMQQKRFSTAMVRFYTTQVLLAIEYFHQNNIVYRDLKLENILMTPSGYIKVADYGICKENMSYGSVTRTFCGTPDYMAPEILNHQRYGRAVDWWSLGILVFVMNVGRYPYHGSSEADILDAILSDNVQWPAGVNKDLKDFVQGLLNKNSVKRLGCGKLDAEEVKKHHFFTGIVWDEVLNMTHPAPWKPKISSMTDISNFDPEFTREKPILTPLTSTLSVVEQAEFLDFQYVSDWGRAMRMASVEENATVEAS